MEVELVSDAMMQEIIPDDNDLGEQEMFTSKVKKISSWGIKQDRVLILSTHQIYVLKAGGEVRKRIPIAEVRYIIKAELSNEILIYFAGHYDLRLILDDRDSFLDLLLMRFPIFCPKIRMKYFIISGKESLNEYKVQGNNRRSIGYAFNNEPDKKFRHKDKEPLTEQDVEG